MLYGTLRLTLGPVLRTVFQPEVTGAVPPHGPVILAANHLSFADQVFTPLAAGRQVLYLAKAEYFTAPGISGRVQAAFFRGMGNVPVDRGDVRAAAGVVDTGAALLARGAALGIFPEGTRPPDGRLYKFRTGIARLAVRSGAPVVPVGIVGTREVLPTGSKRWHRAPVAVHFGEPLTFAGRADAERSAKTLREITEQIREAVLALSGQQYVDDYASKLREAA